MTYCVEQDRYVLEPEKRVPIAHDVDVVVAGSGISGLLAALTAGRMGARTVLVDRFGTPGGNLGPGYLVGGGNIEGKRNDEDIRVTLAREGAERKGPALRVPLPSVAGEFWERLVKLRNTPGINYADTANIVSYLGLKMAEESDVELLLSTYAADPIIQDQRVSGLFVEGKSGRVAVKADVVVDSTGDASIAARAGSALINNVARDYKSYGHLLENASSDFAVFNECGLFFFIGNADYDRYARFLEENREVSEEDEAWASRHVIGPKVGSWPPALTPCIRQAWEAGEFQWVETLECPKITISSGGQLLDYGSGVVGARAGMAAGEIDIGNMHHISLVEARLRIHAFEAVQFLRKYVPGFKKAYIIAVSPFLGARGGPCIVGEHTLSTDEAADGARFDDVLFQSFFRRPKVREDWVQTGYDIPYRVLLPRGIDGILTTGRGAAYIRRGHNGTGMRVRNIAMTLGQAAGTAAALCARTGATPFQLDRRLLQQQLLMQGFDLGDKERLTELGLDGSGVTI